MKNPIVRSLLALVLLVTACDDAEMLGPFAGSNDIDLLRGVRWEIVAAVDDKGERLATEVAFHATFRTDGIISGYAGPNGFGGEYEAGADGSLRFSQLASTLIGGPDADKGFQLVNVLVRARRFTVSASELRIEGAGESALHFRRAIQGGRSK